MSIMMVIVVLESVNQHGKGFKKKRNCLVSTYIIVMLKSGISIRKS
jgi:hypothetical protein